jgi:hypothetical protein
LSGEENLCPNNKDGAAALSAWFIPQGLCFLNNHSLHHSHATFITLQSCHFFEKYFLFLANSADPECMRIRASTQTVLFKC